MRLNKSNIDMRAFPYYINYSEPAAPLLCMRNSVGVFLSGGLD